MKIKIKVPASMSNLGAGFDTFGLAVNLYNIFDIKSSKDFSVKFVDLEIKDGENLFLKVFYRCIELFKKEKLPLEITIKTEIHFQGGLEAAAAPL